MSNFMVYVLQNPKGLLYIGQTSNLGRRLFQHNSPAAKSHLGKFAHKFGPWKLVGAEAYSSRSAAMARERELKSWKTPAKVRALFQHRPDSFISKTR